MNTLPGRSASRAQRQRVEIAAGSSGNVRPEAECTPELTRRHEALERGDVIGRLDRQRLGHRRAATRWRAGLAAAARAVGERQTELPGEVGAQKVGQVGAVGREVDACVLGLSQVVEQQVARRIAQQLRERADQLRSILERHGRTAAPRRPRRRPRCARSSCCACARRDRRAHGQAARRCRSEPLARERATLACTRMRWQASTRSPSASSAVHLPASGVGRSIKRA